GADESRPQSGKVPRPHVGPEPPYATAVAGQVVTHAGRDGSSGPCSVPPPRPGRPRRNAAPRPAIRPPPQVPARSRPLCRHAVSPPARHNLGGTSPGDGPSVP